MALESIPCVASGFSRKFSGFSRKFHAGGPLSPKGGSHTRKIRKSFSAAIAGLTAFTVLLTFSVSGQQTEIRVLASNGVKSAMEDLVPQCERVTGRRLAMEFNSSTSLKQAIEKGETFDVVIGTSELVDALIKDGRIEAASRVGLARAGIGVGIRSGATRPDISTPAALKQTLLNAKAITYAQDGASRPFIVAMLDRFGIADAMKSKTILEQGSIRSTARVAQGDAELVMTLVSEILPIKGIELLGPFPDALQNYVSFAAGVNPKSNDPKSAKALIGFLTGPAAATTFKAKGLEARER
jgi:molybdate transport system substrate-binding protein